ncbi:RNA methyltransferase tRNA(m5U54)methyltransferase [Tilletia horrida]|nr:RNA methyltransferase tRNA(m5U54)methyltransferase [Tilletia horrida]
MAPIPIPLDPALAAASGIHLRPEEAAFRENSATIILPSKDAAFLNPVQEFNRDISTLVIRTWAHKTDQEKYVKWQARQEKRLAKIKAGTWTRHPPASHSRAGKRRKLENGEAASSSNPEGEHQSATEDYNAQDDSTYEPTYHPFKFTILEALAATGLRSIRYAKEIPNLKWVLANDLSNSAVQAMKRNLALNFPAGRPIEEWKPDPNNPTTSTVAATIAATKAAKKNGGAPVPAQDSQAQAEPANGHTARALTSAEVEELGEAVANGDQEAAKTLSEWRKAGSPLVAPEPPAQTASETAHTDQAQDPQAQSAHGGPVPLTAEQERRAALQAAGIHPDCKVRPHEGDAVVLQYLHRDPAKRFHVVDLDPYGSASMFIDGAVQAVADGGLLCVTCTDLAILAGNNYPEKCFSQYGGVNVRSEFSHEAALRLVLHTISSSASRYSRYITPLLSLSIDFYLRVFVEVRTSPIETKRTASKTGLVHVCSSCQNFHHQPFGKVTEVQNEKKGTSYLKFGGSPALTAGQECTECGGRMQTAGPMWTGPIHDSEFCKQVLAQLEEDPLRFHTAARIKGMVTLAANEIENALFYFTPTKISGLLHCENPTLKTVVSTLLRAGFEVSRSHCVPGSLKTTATRAQCFDLFRSWISKRSPVMMSNIKPGSPSRKLMGKAEARKALLDRLTSASASATSSEQETTEGGSSSSTSHHTIINLVHGYGAGPDMIDFEIVDDHERAEDVLASGEKIVRYQMNPLPNWGPGKAAKVTKSEGKQPQQQPVVN